MTASGRLLERKPELGPLTEAELIKEVNHMNNPFEDMPVVFRYTRAQAIEDGVLIDLSEWAKETGFRIPVACTATVWNDHITPPPGAKAYGQSERGRAHDVLWMLFCAIKRGKQRDDRLVYDVIFQDAPKTRKTVQLKSICGPGDQGEPVLTIMLPHED